MSMVLVCSVVLAGGSCRPHRPGYAQWGAKPGRAPEPAWVKGFSRGVGRVVLTSHALHA